MIPSFYNFSVPPTWAEIQAAQVAEAHQVEDIPKAEVRDWSHLTMQGGMITFEAFLWLFGRTSYQSINLCNF